MSNGSARFLFHPKRFRGLVLGRTTRHTDVAQADVIEIREFRTRMNTPSPFGNDLFQLTATQHDTWINCRENEVRRGHANTPRFSVRGTVSQISQRGCDEQHNKCCRDKTMIMFRIFVFAVDRHVKNALNDRLSKIA
jgi:hypothetical protein